MTAFDATLSPLRPDDGPIDATRWPDVAHAPSTLRARLARPVAERIFLRAVDRMPIRVLLPDGHADGGGAATLGAPTMVVHDAERLLRRLGDSGLIGFGESYCAGEWDSPDLAPLIAAFADAIDELVPAPLARLRAAYLARQPHTDRQTTDNSRSNVERHYDLSNEMFALFLDETMSYSAALFDPPPTYDAHTHPQPLAEAQRAKIDRLLDQAGVGEGTRVLEIGSGWGELALRAAQRGAHVDTITLSSEQLDLTRDKVRGGGVGDRVDARLLDYREVTGSYDAVVSVEMIEAVGLDFLDTYFATIQRVLRPGGRAAIQAITMPHHRVDLTRGGYTWIHKYIFPGGALASRELLLEEAGRAGLSTVDTLSMGSSYALTLRQWRQEFDEQRDALCQLGFDHTFQRMWRFYLGYSEGGFRSGYLDVHQLTFEAGA